MRGLAVSFLMVLPLLAGCLSDDPRLLPDPEYLHGATPYRGTMDVASDWILLPVDLDGHGSLHAYRFDVPTDAFRSSPGGLYIRLEVVALERDGSAREREWGLHLFGEHDGQLFAIGNRFRAAMEERVWDQEGNLRSTKVPPPSDSSIVNAWFPKGTSPKSPVPLYLIVTSNHNNTAGFDIAMRFLLNDASDRAFSPVTAATFLENRTGHAWALEPTVHQGSGHHVSWLYHVSAADGTAWQVRAGTVAFERLRYTEAGAEKFQIATGHDRSGYTIASAWFFGESGHVLFEVKTDLHGRADEHRGHEVYSRSNIVWIGNPSLELIDSVQEGDGGANTMVTIDVVDRADVRLGTTLYSLGLPLSDVFGIAAAEHHRPPFGRLVPLPSDGCVDHHPIASMAVRDLASQTPEGGPSPPTTAARPGSPHNPFCITTAFEPSW